MMKKMVILCALFGLSSVTQAADSNFIPRVGVQMGDYSLWGAEVIEEVTFGGNAGVSYSSGKFLTDLNVEALSFSGGSDDIWRSEIALTVGYAFYRSAYVIGGYRTAKYGDSIFSDDFGDMDGPFLGLALAGLQMGDDAKDIFDFSFAVNANKFTDGLGNTSDSDVGVSLRLGYRRAGSPHSVGIRYQSFSSDAFDEYFTTIGYSYTFF